MKSIFLIALFSLCPLLAKADNFVPDLGDSPSNATTGYFAVQGLVFGVITFSGKFFLDDNGAKKADWIPGAFLFGAGLLIHSHFFFEGGNNASLAWQEQGWQTAGISIGMAI